MKVSWCWIYDRKFRFAPVGLHRGRQKGTAYIPQCVLRKFGEVRIGRISEGAAVRSAERVDQLPVYVCRPPVEHGDMERRFKRRGVYVFCFSGGINGRIGKGCCRTLSDGAAFFRKRCPFGRHFNHSAADLGAENCVDDLLYEGKKIKGYLTGAWRGRRSDVFAGPPKVARVCCVFVDNDGFGCIVMVASGI